MNRTGEWRVVVVTGANEGIGHHTLRALVERGYRVAGLDIDGSNVRPLQASHPNRVRFYQCDLTNDDDVETAIEDVLSDWGRVDILLNNAAIFNYGFVEDRTLDDTREEFEVNYFGYLRTIRAVLPHMLARGEGRIHNVSSGVSIAGHPGLSGYASTKGAIEAFVRSLQQELRHENVSCSLVYPPLTNTRSAGTLYPKSMMTAPETVGRKLAEKIESTRPVIVLDWQTKIGLFVVRLFPFVAKRGTERFVEEREVANSVQ
ncbi:SDR family NAD(P)-dependent oxidoreductase [Haloferax sp. YSMS24]|uniref:SDR family NAD(P)-dependent oxidoreductase n=1 Tax=Haloferax sp. YSMS24 TaxID=3388425 RepID=UPI00398CF742